MKEKFKNEYSVGTRIKARREELKLSRKVVCEQLGGVALSTLQLWEQNEREPQASTLMKLGEILDISPAYLLTGEEQAISRPLLTEELTDTDKLKQAILVLEKALKTTEKQANALELTNDELQLILSFRRCNVDRQLIALSAVEALADQTDKELTSSYTETEDSVA